MERWRWSDGRAEACERAIRELLADAARGQHADVEERAARLLAAATELVPLPAPAPVPAGEACEWCRPLRSIGTKSHDKGLR